MEAPGVDQVPSVEPADTAGGAEAAPTALIPPPLSAEVAAAPDFRTLFKQHFPYVWHTLRRLGVPERDLADLTHDVFLELHRHLAEFEPGRPLRAWIFGFAFRVGSHYRRRARHRYELMLDADASDGAPSALEQVLTSEALDIAHVALQALELDRRAVFLLHDVDGYSMPEVSATLGVPLNTAYSRLRLARQEFHARVRRIRRQRGEP